MPAILLLDLTDFAALSPTKQFFNGLLTHQPPLPLFFGLPKMRKSTAKPVSAGRYRWLLYAAAVVPFVCAVVAHGMGPTPQPSTPTDKTAGLIFEQYLIDLGEVPPLPMLEARFRFSNQSDRTVTIKELKPSCGCLHPRLKKKVYQPGESGEFSVRVETVGEKSGPKEYYVDIAYDSDELQQTQVQFDFVLPERKVVVTPRALIFYQLSNVAVTREIIVTDYREKPLRVLEWSCNSPYVRASIGKVNDATRGIQTVAVEVTVAGNVPAGKHQAILNLKTDDPTHPQLRIPLWIQGATGAIRHATAKPKAGKRQK